MVMDRNGMSHKPAGLPQGEAGAFDGKAGPGGADDLEAPGGFNTSMFNPFTEGETGLLDEPAGKAMRDEWIAPFRHASPHDPALRDFLRDADGLIVDCDGVVGRLAMPRGGAGEAVVEIAKTGERRPIAAIDKDGDVERLLPAMPEILTETGYNDSDFDRMTRLRASEDDGELGEALGGANSDLRDIALLNPHLSDETLNRVVADRWVGQERYSDGNAWNLFRNRTLDDETACALFERGIRARRDWVNAVAKSAVHLTAEQQLYLCLPRDREGVGSRDPYDDDGRLSQATPAILHRPDLAPETVEALAIRAAAKGGRDSIAYGGEEMAIRDFFMSDSYPVERLRTQPFFADGNPKVRFGRKKEATPDDDLLTDDQSRELSRQAWIALARRGTRAERRRLSRSRDWDIAKAARDSLAAEDRAKDGPETV